MEEKEITTVVEYNALGATLTEMANRAREVSEPNKELRTQLQKARTRIEKIGKFLREDAVRVSKEVLAKEKELIAIIEPEEKRLKALEEEADRKAEAEKRKALLPERIEKLARIGDGQVSTDELLLAMDDTAFEAHYNARVMAKNNADRAIIEERERALKEKEDEAKREADMKAREEQARADERARLEREEVERKNRERREAEEAKIREEQDIAYQMFLASHGYEEGSGGKFFVKRNADKSVDLYGLLGTFNPE